MLVLIGNELERVRILWNKIWFRHLKFCSLNFFTRINCFLFCLGRKMWMRQFIYLFSLSTASVGLRGEYRNGGINDTSLARKHRTQQKTTTALRSLQLQFPVTRRKMMHYYEFSCSRHLYDDYCFIRGDCLAVFCTLFSQTNITKCLVFTFMLLLLLILLLQPSSTEIKKNRKWILYCERPIVFSCNDEKKKKQTMGLSFCFTIDHTSYIIESSYNS